ncbi:glycosyltransferase [Leifsonia sp. ALI-44-B]|uniref:TIGR04282 family arsenosugar biosynthesis glycosyltransferase n=1 Tax=Leifsonia sp. ALI-44-B TaxID=1933776 RepID=UPI00097BD71D|nr:DUF2064 domain-containing protein [Leifsonia sp. ALI-44-B]ONI61548.1 glycosyltransferase [Leifsonia sp. ALI-44-B]
MTTLIVIAKETIPGKVKTRLHPPLSYEQAAEVAAAAIQDTLAAASAVDVDRRILYFDGNLFPPGSEDYEVVPQGTGDLDVRLAHIFDHCTGPTVLIGMDTPQLDAQVLRDMFARWAAEDEATSTSDADTDAGTTDVFFGFANDGGFWTLGMREPDGSLIRGVPMSQDDTGRVQLDRLKAVGLGVSLVPELVDVDTIDDARTVATLAPHTRFAETLRRIEGTTSATAEGARHEHDRN